MTKHPDIRAQLPRGTQAALARRLRVGRAYVNHALSDHRQHIGRDIKVAAALIARVDGKRMSLDFWFPPATQR